MGEKSKFDASNSIAGYLYQCRLALLIGLRILPKNPNGHISIEKFDDISFETEDHVQCLVQAKHSVAPKSLSDSSPDVWKTFRIWLEDNKQGALGSTSTKRLLITTAMASEDSALAKLRYGTNKLDRSEARKRLQKVALESEDKSTAAGRAAFLLLTEEEADVFLSTIDILDAQPDLHDLYDEIKAELFLLSPDHVTEVAEAVEGWWLATVVTHLAGTVMDKIPLQNLIKKASEVGDSFGPTGLPVATAAELSAPEYSAADENLLFVKQMRILKIVESAVHRGSQDFYRAQAQRSRWARENLLLDGEAAKFDAKLKDLWARKFDADCALQSGGNEDAKLMAGRVLFNWATIQQIPFRNIIETWITAGSFHGLANMLEVGWHPDYLDIFGQDAGDE